MKRTRSKSLSALVITKPDLLSIYSFIKRKGPVTVTIESANSLRTEADDESVFNNDVIDLRKTLSISLRYANYRVEESISVTLTEQDDGSSYGNSFSVSGSSAEWVESTFSELEAIFSAVKPQENLLRKYRWFFIVLAALLLGPYTSGSTRG